MWNYIKGLFRTGDPLKKLYYVFMSFISCILVIGTFPAGLIFSIGAFAMIRETVKLFSEVGIVPYWGDVFGKKVIFKLLAEDDFSPYIDKKGNVYKRVQISKSGRWIKVKGKYYPIPFLKGIEFPKNTVACNLIMIDGSKIRVDELRSKKIAPAIKELLQSSTDYSPEVCKQAFYAAKTAVGASTVAETDWNEFRYAWEQKCIEISGEQIGEKAMAKHLRSISDYGFVKDHIGNRSFTDEELEAVSNAIKSRKIRDIKPLIDFSNYEKDIYICNSAVVFEKVGYPRNADAEDFLFECLKDIKKPYFDDAIRALGTFPREHLIEAIEKKVEIAHEAGDYLWGAGLIALAKSIDYEISLAKEAKEEKELQEAKETTEEVPAVAFKIQ